MNTLKFLLLTVFFINIIGTQQINAQNDFKELKTQIKVKKDQVSANEEILMSGIKALKRVTANLEDFKKSKKATKNEVNRKEKIVANMQDRLTKLNSQIDNQKENLASLERKLTRKTKKSTPKKTATQKAKNNVETPIKDNVSELAIRKQKLEEARRKIEESRKAKEIAYLKEQEALRLEVEKLEQ